MFCFKTDHNLGMSRIFPTVFRILLVYFLAFVWVRYFVNSLPLVLLFTALITFAIEILFMFLMKKRQTKRNLRGEKFRYMQNVTDTLAMWNRQRQMEFFTELVQKKHQPEKIPKNKADAAKGITIAHQNGKVILFPVMQFSPLSADGLAQLLDGVQCKKAVVACLLASPEAKKLAADFSAFSIVILEREQVYSALLSAYEHYPPAEQIFKRKVTKKRKLKELFGGALRRDRTKGYLTCAIFLFVASLFVRWNWYYAIMASLMLLLAIATIVLPYVKGKTEIGILDEPKEVLKSKTPMNISK